MITCQLMGGLGNQLFQICATISYAIQYNQSFKFLNVSSLGGVSCTQRPTYWTTMLKRFQVFLTPSIQAAYTIREQSFAYKQLPPHMGGYDATLIGYFQSYKYFQNHYDTICKLIQVDVLQQRLLSKLRWTPESMVNTVSMHFRIGDYKAIQDCHPILPYLYYEKALTHLQTIYPTIPFTVLYFCEQVDIQDVERILRKLQEQFPTYIFARGDHSLADWEQLLLMSTCRHNIIANSSFSWWAEYFNQWPDKTVCYPSVWFGPKLASHDTRDLCPPEWQRIH